MRANNPLSRVLTPRPFRPSSAYLAFCRARQQMNLRALDWMKERPDPDDVDDEISATVAVLRQLVRLTRMGEGGNA